MVTMPKRTCFVIMPFGKTTEKHTEEYWNAHFKDFIKPAIEEAMDDNHRLGYQARLANPPGGAIIDDVLANLQEADVVLADLTDFSPNVVYEIGIRHTLRDRTIMILEEGQEIPFYFKTYKIIPYSTIGAQAWRKFKDTIERRLLDLKQDSPALSDNPVSDYFRRTGQSVWLISTKAADIPTLRKQGFSGIYTPQTNDQRNARKQQVIREAKQNINLLASSGRAYLARAGSYFNGFLEESLKANVPVRMILVNPWSDSRVLMALGELSGSTASLTPIQIEALKQFEQGSLIGFDPVELIKQSIYYHEKYDPSIRGYKELKSQKQFSDNIELRISTHAVHATMLLTEATGFFEPYLPVNLNERLRKSIISFELEFSDSNYFYKHCMDYFDMLWKLSIPYEKFVEMEDTWKEQLREKYERKTDSPGSST